MHDCPKIQEKLFDLVFGEILLDEQRRILAEIAACAFCQTELESIEKTLQIYDQATAFNEPTGAEWQLYERNLKRRVVDGAQTKVRKPFWFRIAFASVQIPAPVFAAAVLLFCTTGFFALRSIAKHEAAQPSIEIVQTPVSNSERAAAVAPDKIIVREERVVIRKIYFARSVKNHKQSKPAVIQNSADGNLDSLNLSVALEAEGNLFPQKRFDGRAAQGLFGVKAGKRYNKFGVFAKARPGFVYQSQGQFEYSLRSNASSADPFPFDYRVRSQTSFALDAGGVVEFYPAKRLVTRFDFGDTIIATPPRTVNFPAFQNGAPTLQSIHLSTRTTHNFQFSAGIGFRF